MQLRIVVAYLVHTKDIAYVVKKPRRGFILAIYDSLCYNGVGYALQCDCCPYVETMYHIVSNLHTTAHCPARRRCGTSSLHGVEELLYVVTFTNRYG